jgi:hypothetical protein
MPMYTDIDVTWTGWELVTTREPCIEWESKVSCFAPTDVRPSVVVVELDVDIGVGAGVLVGGSVGVVRVGVHVAVGELVGAGVLVGRGVGVAVGGSGVDVRVGVRVGVGVSVGNSGGMGRVGSGTIWASVGRAGSVSMLATTSTTAAPARKRAVVHMSSIPLLC